MRHYTALLQILRLCGIVFIADYVDGSAEVEFLNALVIPLRDSSGITFMRGVDGFPAFSFASTANVQRPANELVYRVGPDFSFVASILPLTAAGGSVPAALLTFRSQRCQLVTLCHPGLTYILNF